MSVLRRPLPGAGWTCQMVLRMSLSSPTTPVAPMQQGHQAQHRGEDPCRWRPGLLNHRLDGSGTLLAHDPLDFGHDLALAASCPNTRAATAITITRRGAREKSRVISQGSPCPWRFVCTPGIPGLCEQFPEVFERHGPLLTTPSVCPRTTLATAWETRGVCIWGNCIIWLRVSSRVVLVCAMLSRPQSCQVLRLIFRATPAPDDDREGRETWPATVYRDSASGRSPRVVPAQYRRSLERSAAPARALRP